jgi:hypothetical protein
MTIGMPPFRYADARQYAAFRADGAVNRRSVWKGGRICCQAGTVMNIWSRGGGIVLRTGSVQPRV